MKGVDQKQKCIAANAALRFDSKRICEKHLPSCPPCHGPPTLSPSFHTFSDSGTATTVPMTSWPGMIGNPFPKPPCCTTASEWQTPTARTLTRTWSNDGEHLPGDKAIGKRGAGSGSYCAQGI